MTGSFGDLLLFVGLVAVVAAVGFALGILVLAPRLTSLSTRDEEAGDPADERHRP